MTSNKDTAGDSNIVSFSHTEDRLDPHIKDDHGDPHRAALEVTAEEGHVSPSTWAAVFFMGFTFQPSLTFTILCCFPILVGQPFPQSTLKWLSNSTRHRSHWSFKGVHSMLTGWLLDGRLREVFLLLSLAN